MAGVPAGGLGRGPTPDQRNNDVQLAGALRQGFTRKGFGTVLGFADSDRAADKVLNDETETKGEILALNWVAGRHLTNDYQD